MTGARPTRSHRPWRAIAAIGAIALIIGVTTMNEHDRPTGPDSDPDPGVAAAVPSATPFTEVGATPEDRDSRIRARPRVPGPRRHAGLRPGGRRSRVARLPPLPVGRRARRTLRARRRRARGRHGLGRRARPHGGRDVTATDDRLGRGAGGRGRGRPRGRDPRLRRRRRPDLSRPGRQARRPARAGRPGGRVRRPRHAARPSARRWPVRSPRARRAG